MNEIEICNKAFLRLGANTVTDPGTGLVADLDPDSSTEAKLAQLLYPSMRDIALEDGVWTFALQRQSLSKIDPAPLTDAAYSNRSFFLPPVDSLLIYRCILPGRGPNYGNQTETQVDWRKEGAYILADGDTIHVMYIQQLIDTTLFTAKFVDALSIRCAMEWTTPLTENRVKEEDLKKEYEFRVQEARSIDGQQMRSERFVSNKLSQARFIDGGSTFGPTV